jgi:hypothetical protein
VSKLVKQQKEINNKKNATIDEMYDEFDKQQKHQHIDDEEENCPLDDDDMDA